MERATFLMEEFLTFIAVENTFDVIGINYFVSHTHNTSAAFVITHLKIEK